MSLGGCGKLEDSEEQGWRGDIGGGGTVGSNVGRGGIWGMVVFVVGVVEDRGGGGTVGSNVGR